MLAISLFIALYAVVQSIFGVGLLVFGTPTLLLLGYDFDHTLVMLLPCSMVVNSLQVAQSWKKIDLKREFVLYGLPPVALGLYFTIRHGQHLNIRLHVGLLMLVTALLRTSSAAGRSLQHWTRSHSRLALAVIGALHGLTNMGGGLLSLFVSGRYREKEKARATVAFGYLAMATCQLTVLLSRGAVKPVLASSGGAILALAGLSGALYLAIGNRLFSASSEQLYQRLLTVFISVFGLTLVFA